MRSKSSRAKTDPTPVKKVVMADLTLGYELMQSHTHLAEEYLMQFIEEP